MLHCQAPYLSYRICCLKVTLMIVLPVDTKFLLINTETYIYIYIQTERDT